MDITQELQDSVLIITMQQQKRTNPWTLSMIQQLQQILRDVNSRPEVKGIVVTGAAKRAFSLGGDLDELKSLAASKQLPAWITAKTQLFNTLLDLEKPVVASIDRYCIGLGLITSLLFDWRVASDKTQFFLPEVAHGIEASIVVEVITSVLHLNLSRRLLYKSEPLDSDQALHWGLIDEMVPAAELLQYSITMAHHLGHLPQATFKSTKQSMMRHLKSALDMAALKDAAFISESSLFHSIE